MLTSWMSLLAEGVWDGALRGAIIGAAIGGVVGVVVWLTRKSRGGDGS